jgi:methyl-accepting chemotaxis protein
MAMSEEQKYIIKVEGKTDQAIKEIRKLNKEVKNLQDVSKRATSNMEAQAKQVKSLNTGFKQLSAHLARLVVIYGSLATASNLVKTMNDLEQSMTGVAKTTGLAGDELDTLSDSLDEMSVELKGVTISELQAIAESAGQLGVKGSDDILTFTEQVAKISVAVNMSADETGKAFARLQNATG